MASHNMTRFIWCYLAILLTFGQVFGVHGAKYPPEKVPDKDSLQIRLRYDLFAKPKEEQSIMFSSHLEFEQMPQISDKQFMAIAVDAFKEMEEMCPSYRIGKATKPSVMTTLIVGNEIIMASSVKGKLTIDPDGNVAEDLDRCRKDGGDDHMFGRKCGEVMAFDAYYTSRVNPQKLDKSARIVAIAKEKKTAQDEETYVIRNPCGTDREDKWGCNKLVKGLNVLTSSMVDNDKTEEVFDWRKMMKSGNLKIKLLPTPTNDGKPKGNPKPTATEEDIPPPNTHRMTPNEPKPTAADEEIPPPNTHRIAATKEEIPPHNTHQMTPNGPKPTAADEDIPPPNTHRIAATKEEIPPHNTHQMTPNGPEPTRKEDELPPSKPTRTSRPTNAAGEDGNTDNSGGQDDNNDPDGNPGRDPKPTKSRRPRHERARRDFRG